MKDHLFELNLPKTLPDLRGKVPFTMSAEAFLQRFFVTRDALPKEVTVLPPFDVDAYGGCDVVVSPSGDDTADGTWEAPLKTLAAALERVKGKGGATITLRGGAYPITAPVALTAEHSGTADRPLVLRAAKGETPVLTANKTLSSERALWSPADPATDAVAARLPKEAQGKVLVTHIGRHGLTADDMAEITDKGAPRLFVDGEEYVLARYPNRAASVHDLLYFTHAYDTGTVTIREGSDLYWAWHDRAMRDFDGDLKHNVGFEIRLPNAKDNDECAAGMIRKDPEAEAKSQFVLSWVNTGNVWYFGSIFEGWEFLYRRLAKETEGRLWAHYAESDTEKKTPLLGTFVPDENGPYTYEGQKGYYSLKSTTYGPHGCKHSTNSPARRNTFYLFNAIEALDEPGEWFYDVDTGLLYVYPKDEEAFYGSVIGYSGKDEYAPLTAEGLTFAILDGIGIDGSNGGGVTLTDCSDVVVQHMTGKNTKKTILTLSDCRHSAVLYSDFSAAYSNMVTLSSQKNVGTLTPSMNLVQNCFFHDAKPTFQYALSNGDCRAVISHNYFRNTCMVGAGWENLTEYNRFDGGNGDVVDGGMHYACAEGARDNHIRYNLFHMFNQTHNAVYNDGMNSGNYTYGNIVSTLGSKCNHHKGWYSSTGMGNVCFGNLMVFRDPWEVAGAHSVAGDEDDKVAVGVGDNTNQSALFYFYFGKEHAAVTNRRYEYVVEGRKESLAVDYGPTAVGKTAHQSLAGHWWEGRKKQELDRYLVEGREEPRKATDPAYINHLYGTRLILDALDNSDYLIKYFYLPARWTGKTYTSKAAPAGCELLIPAYTYLDEEYNPVTVEEHTVIVPESGEVTLAYEEIAAMERLRRAPAYCVVKNNVLLGGTPLMNEARTERVGDVDEADMISDSLLRTPDTWLEDEKRWIFRKTEGYNPSTMKSHNFLRYEYDKVMKNARAYDYEILPEAREAIRATLEPEAAEAVLALDATKTGPTYGFDYASLGPVRH